MGFIDCFQTKSIITWCSISQWFVCMNKIIDNGLDSIVISSGTCWF
jgi:hypothetical protein